MTVTDTPKVGAYVLETLTTGMYMNPLDALREYVQNATDSVHRAESARAIATNKGRIELIVDADKRTLTIRDNGMGIHSADVRDKLLNVGMSDKEIGRDAGFRGIGRLAGIAYCKRLRFRTSAASEAATSVVEMDCEGLVKSISPAARQKKELAEILGENSSVSKGIGKADEHFFEVVMEGISGAAPVFLDDDALDRYLSQVAPVEFDAQHFMFATKIRDWLRERHIVLPSVTLVIKMGAGEWQVFKPYKGHYRTHQRQSESYKVEIRDICFYPEYPEGSPFWVWYGKSELLGQIDCDKSAGLRIRRENFALGGPENVADLFGRTAESNRRFNAYYVGEIHVLSPNAIPNARRDGFEDVGAWPEIREQLMPFVRERCEDVRVTSDARNRPMVKVVRSAKQLIENATERLELGLASPKERDDLVEKLKKEEKRAAKALSARKDAQERQEIAPLVEKLRDVRETIQKENKFGAKRYSSNLDRKQRKVIDTILEILREELDEENERKVRAAIADKFGLSLGGSAK